MGPGGAGNRARECRPAFLSPTFWDALGGRYAAQGGAQWGAEGHCTVQSSGSSAVWWVSAGAGTQQDPLTAGGSHPPPSSGSTPHQASWLEGLTWLGCWGFHLALRASVWKAEGVSKSGLMIILFDLKGLNRKKNDFVYSYSCCRSGLV